MARQQVAIILDAELPLDDGETQVADLADGAADNTQCKDCPPRRSADQLPSRLADKQSGVCHAVRD